MEIEESIILAMINSVSEPIYVIVPKQTMSDEDMVRLFKAFEGILDKIGEKTDMEFDILVESATYFGGYNDLSEAAEQQRTEVEDELSEMASGAPSDDSEEIGSSSEIEEDDPGIAYEA